MSDRQVRIIISASVEEALRGMRQVEQGLGRVGRQGQEAGSQASTFGEKLKAGLGAAGVVGGIAGVATAIGYVIRQGVSFQDNMNSLKAVTGASASEMDRLSTRARELGKDIDLPATSASDASEALLELAKGGLSVNESMSAAKGTLLLAAAAGITGAQAAEIQANALNAFALSGDNANHVADVLANTASAASGDIADFAAGMQQSATVAHAFGIGIEDTATTLGLFAKAGIQGSDAGTSFKTMLTALASPTLQQQKALDALNLTVYDAKGNFVGMKSITEQLAAAKGNLTQQEYNAAASTAFGSDAVRAANILAEGGVAAWDNMSDAVNKAGGAAELAGARTQGVSGAFGKLMSSVEDASIALFDKFAPALEAGLGFAASLVGSLGDLIGWFSDLPAPVQAGAAALAALILLKGPIMGLWTAMKASGVGLTIQGEMLAAKLAITSVRLEAAATGGSMTVLGAGMRVAGIAALGLGNSLKAAFLSNPIGIALVVATTALTAFMSATSDAEAATSDLTGAVDEQTGALTDNAAGVAAKAAADSGAAAAYKAAGGAVSDYTAALLGNPEKQKLVNDTLTKAAEAAAATAAATKDAGDATTSYSGGLGDQTEAFKSATGTIQIFHDDLAKVAEAQDKGKLTAEGMAGAQDVNAAATAAAGAAADAAAERVKGYADALKEATDNASTMAGLTEGAQQMSDLASAASDAARALDIFKIAQDNADGRTRSLDEATANQNKTLRSLNDALKDGTAAATENSKAGDLNVEALNNWDVAALTATESGSKVFDEMGRMADQYGETTTAAYSNAVATGNVAGAADVARQAATDSRKSFVDLMTQYNGGNIPAAEALADKLGILDGQKIDNKTFETINDDALAQQKLRDAQAAEIANKEFAINVQDNATRTLQYIQGLSIADKFFTITQTNNIVNREITEAANTYQTGGPGLEDGGVVHAAAGRIVAGRGRSGVMDGSGAGLTWAEQATGKEYYLSMKAGMESRNRSLATQAVSDLGGQAMWGRAGDVRNGSFSPSTAAAPMQVQITLNGGDEVAALFAQVAAVTVNGAYASLDSAVRTEGAVRR